MPPETILFVTGRLAEPSLRNVVSEIAERKGFRYEIAVPGVQVAALLHTGLLLKRLQVGPHISRVVLPGWCHGDVGELETHFGVRFERGPKDLHDLPDYFGTGKRVPADLSRYSTEIIAEINHATQLSPDAVLAEAHKLVAEGADIIDVGCVPGETSENVEAIVRRLRAENIRVSIDSFDQYEVEQAIAAGAELILSCNHSNIEWISKLNTEVVAIPDSPEDLNSLDDIISMLRDRGIPFRMDPILEPVGMGFTQSLERYIIARRRHPDVPMMMGIGNVTELSEVDSAGVNFLLAAVCEELGIQSVLTTQVINWCRTAVREFDAARRLLHYAVSSRKVPKHIDSSLLMLRDARLRSTTMESLKNLASALTDPGFRIFAECGSLHLMNCHGHWHGPDVFQLFRQAVRDSASPSAVPDSAHAFYLGYELARAEIALHLGKQYVQDSPLQWGLLGERAASAPATHENERKSD